MMKYTVLTLFPNIYNGFKEESIIKRAIRSCISSPSTSRGSNSCRWGDSGPRWCLCTRRWTWGHSRWAKIPAAIFFDNSGGMASPMMVLKSISSTSGGKSQSAGSEETMNNSRRVSTLASLYVPSAKGRPGWTLLWPLMRWLFVVRAGAGSSHFMRL